jgi:RimJ/RimL family protein N-acetyltransferase
VDLFRWYSAFARSLIHFEEEIENEIELGIWMGHKLWNQRYATAAIDEIL